MICARKRVAVPFVAASAVMWLCVAPLVVDVHAQQDALAKAKDLYAIGGVPRGARDTESDAGRLGDRRGR